MAMTTSSSCIPRPFPRQRLRQQSSSFLKKERPFFKQFSPAQQHFSPVGYSQQRGNDLLLPVVALNLFVSSKADCQHKRSFAVVDQNRITGQAFRQRHPPPGEVKRSWILGNVCPMSRIFAEDRLSKKTVPLRKYSIQQKMCLFSRSIIHLELPFIVLLGKRIQISG